MPINRDEMLSVITQLSEQEDLRVTVKESAKGACIVGGTAFAGGIVGGPVGLAIGGVMGSFASLIYGRGRYRSVVDVIMYDMTPSQKIRLADSVEKALQDLRIEDFTLLLPLVLNNAPVKELVIREVTRFIQNEMSMSIGS